MEAEGLRPLGRETVGRVREVRRTLLTAQNQLIFRSPVDIGHHQTIYVLGSGVCVMISFSLSKR